MTGTTAKVTGARALIRALESAGVKYIFGLSGHANLSLLDEIHQSSITFISVAHEQLAVHAADGYFRASHRPGVVLTTLGPGISNTTAALVDAMHDHSAIILLAANAPVASSGQDAYQELAVHSDWGQLELVRPAAKRVWRVSHPAQLMPFLTRAYIVAMSGAPGPVVLDLPMDIMSMTDEFDVVDLEKRRAPRGPAATAEHIQEAAALLAGARRPLIYCGGGAVLSEAFQEVRVLAETLQAPVATTLVAQGVMPNDHPLVAGVTGSVGCRPAQFVAANADVVLAVGSKFSDMDCNSLNPDFFFTSPDTRVIQVDIDPAQIGKSMPISLGVVSDAKVSLSQLASALQSGERQQAARDDWIQAFRHVKESWDKELHDSRASAEVPLVPDRVLRELRDSLDEGACILAGIGPRYLVAQHFPVRQPWTHFAASGSGTMGFAVPAALGVKLARPEAQVVCVCGDGELKSVSPALAAAAEYNVPVVWVILDNYSYNVIELYQSKYFDQRFIGTVFKTPDGQLYSPDYCSLAEAYGLLASRVTNPAELKAAVGEALSSGRPYVIDVKVTRRPRLRASGFWDANRYLVQGWNDEKAEGGVGGFGDAGPSVPFRRAW